MLNRLLWVRALYLEDAIVMVLDIGQSVRLCYAVFILLVVDSDRMAI